MLATDLLERFLAHLCLRLTDDDHHRVTRQQPHEAEDHERRQKEYRQRGQEAFEQIPTHGVLTE